VTYDLCIKGETKVNDTAEKLLTADAQTHSDGQKPQWERVTRYGRADLTAHPLIREAYKVACLIERCGASVELTQASSAAFDLCEKFADVLCPESDDPITEISRCMRKIDALHGRIKSAVDRIK
jgi:hypothetical protein